MHAPIGRSPRAARRSPHTGRAQSGRRLACIACGRACMRARAWRARMRAPSARAACARPSPVALAAVRRPRGVGGLSKPARAGEGGGDRRQGVGAGEEAAADAGAITAPDKSALAARRLVGARCRARCSRVRACLGGAPPVSPDLEVGRRARVGRRAGRGTRGVVARGSMVRRAADDWGGRAAVARRPAAAVRWVARSVLGHGLPAGRGVQAGTQGADGAAGRGDRGQGPNRSARQAPDRHAQPDPTQPARPHQRGSSGAGGLNSGRVG